MTESTEASVKTIPANLEAERAVLGSLLIDPDAMVKVASFLREEDFYRERHQWIFGALVALHERREPADFVTLVDELERKEQLEEVGGPAYITELINSTPTAIYVDYYARIVERTAILRRLIGAAGKIAELAYDESNNVDEVVDRAEQIIFGVSESRIHRELTPISSIMQNVVNQIDFLARNQNTLMGVPTGFSMMDKMLGGFQKSDLIILAGRPGMGKTSLGLSIAQNAAKRYNARVAVFSLEMSNEQLVQRLLSVESAIDSHRLRLGQIYEEEWPILMEAANTLAATHIFIDDTPGASVMDLRTKSRRLYAEHGIDLIVIDYMQLMTGTKGSRGNENRQQEISFISRSLKELARELNVPVLAISQLSRAVESRSDKRPMLSDLRESGCLAGDTLVYLPLEGRYVPIRDLAGTKGFSVAALDTESWKLETLPVSHAFCTGEKPVFRLTTRLGRSIRATANHKFLTIDGWRRLDELTAGHRLALPRSLNGPSQLNMTKTALGNEYCGTTLYQQNISRDRAARLATVVESTELDRLAQSDVYWDEIVSIEPDGIADVYDLTVPGQHNFVANNIIVHNSIEQDADVVLFVYREDYYVEDTDRQNIADVIVAKHRHGSTGTVSLFFRKELTQFRDLEIQREELEY
jgi:replicative DNA helicase